MGFDIVKVGQDLTKSAADAVVNFIEDVERVVENQPEIIVREIPVDPKLCGREEVIFEGVASPKLIADHKKAFKKYSGLVKNGVKGLANSLWISPPEASQVSTPGVKAPVSGSVTPEVKTPFYDRVSDSKQSKPDSFRTSPSDAAEVSGSSGKASVSDSKPPIGKTALQAPVSDSKQPIAIPVSEESAAFNAMKQGFRIMMDSTAGIVLDQTLQVAEDTGRQLANGLLKIIPVRAVVNYGLCKVGTKLPPPARYYSAAGCLVMGLWNTTNAVNDFKHHKTLWNGAKVVLAGINLFNGVETWASVTGSGEMGISSSGEGGGMPSSGSGVSHLDEGAEASPGSSASQALVQSSGNIVDQLFSDSNAAGSKLVSFAEGRVLAELGSSELNAMDAAAFGKRLMRWFNSMDADGQFADCGEDSLNALESLIRQNPHRVIDLLVRRHADNIENWLSHGTGPYAGLENGEYLKIVEIFKRISGEGASSPTAVGGIGEIVVGGSQNPITVFQGMSISGEIGGEIRIGNEVVRAAKK